jgi:two-component system alkaline phosphatase synthesis response regulator PhoP
MKKTIFIVDDERDILDIISINLGYTGYEIKTYTSAEEAITELDSGTVPALIVLDIMMDGMDGYDFCKLLRNNQQWKDIPIIFLSAKSEEFDKVLGLELGADDYITKPFSIKELTSRIKAVLRRTDKSLTSLSSDKKDKKFTYKGVELYPEQFKLIIDGNDVKLTKTEFEILHMFLANPGKIFTRDNIIDSVRGNNIYVVDRTIDVHIMNLRKKLKSYKNIVKTFSGVGYGFKKD